MMMKFTWRGRWKNGEITIEAETFEEIDSSLRVLASLDNSIEGSGTGKDFPRIPLAQGCHDSIRALMETEWGARFRSMNEIRKALEENALYFTKGVLSGTLTTMFKRGELQRAREEGRWKYSASKRA